MDKWFQGITVIKWSGVNRICTSYSFSSHVWCIWGCTYDTQMPEDHNVAHLQKIPINFIWCESVCSINCCPKSNPVWPAGQTTTYSYVYNPSEFDLEGFVHRQQANHRDISFVRRRHYKMPPCSGSSVNTNYERIASWRGCQWRTGGPKNLRDTPRPPLLWPAS